VPVYESVWYCIMLGTRLAAQVDARLGIIIACNFLIAAFV
jgi:hypothetical protein